MTTAFGMDDNKKEEAVFASTGMDGEKTTLRSKRGKLQYQEDCVIPIKNIEKADMKRLPINDELDGSDRMWYCGGC